MYRRKKGHKIRLFRGENGFAVTESELLAVKLQSVSNPDKFLSQYSTKTDLELCLSKREREFLESNGVYLIKPNEKCLELFESGIYPSEIISIVRVFLNRKNKILFETNYVYIKLTDQSDFNAIVSECKSLGLEYSHPLNFTPELHVFSVKEGIDPYRISDYFLNDSRLKYFELDFESIAEQRYIPNSNPKYGKLWHLHNSGSNPNNVNPNGGIIGKIGADVNAQVAWDLDEISPGVPKAGMGIRIAFIEEGFDVDHEDLDTGIIDYSTSTPPNNKQGAIRILVLNNTTFGKNNITPGPLVNGTTSHGTTVAGVAGARDNNKGIVGIAFNSELVPLQFKYSSNQIFARCIAYAADPSQEENTANPLNGVDILSISTAPVIGVRRTSLIDEAVKYATVFGRAGKGLIIISAAENNFEPVAEDLLPELKEIISVGNIGPDDRYFGSAYGANADEIDCVSPGVDIYVTNAMGVASNGFTSPYISGSGLDPNVPDGYISNVDGTSYSAPLVAGIIALMLKAQPKLSWLEVKDILRRSCRTVDIGYGGKFEGIDAFTQETITGDLSWKDNNGNDIVDPVTDNLEIISSPAGRSLQTSINAGVDGVIHGTVDIQINGGTNGFVVGQAILLGAQAVLTAPSNTSGTPQTITVDDASNFSQNQTLRVGFGPQAYVGRSTFSLTGSMKKWLPVIDASGLKINDKIRIKGSSQEIKTIINIAFDFVGGNKYPILILNSDRANDYGEGDIVEYADIDEVEIDSISGNVITLKQSPSPQLSVVHPTGARVEIKSTEARVIREVLSDGITLRIDSLLFNHTANTPVLPGRVPYFSKAYGFGRTDAALAVTTALNYDFHMNHADLIIRDTFADDGLTLISTSSIDSADVAISNTNLNFNIDDFDDANYPSYTSQIVAHENPVRDKDRYVYIRIKNIGKISCFDAQLRVYVALSNPSPTPTFDFPNGWNKAKSIKKIKDGTQGFYLFDDEKYYINQSGSKIPAGSVRGSADTARPSDFRDTEKIFKIKWNREFIPPADSNLLTHVLVQITPFDGQKSGLQVGDNGNLTFKQIQIINRILFKDSPGGQLLDKEIQMSAFATPINKTFAIEINSTAFNADTIKITIIRRTKNQPSDEVVFRKSSGTWGFDGPTPNWIQFSNDGQSTPAGSQTSVVFQGSFDIGPEQKYIKFSVEVEPNTANEFNDTHKTKVKVTDLPEGSGFGDDKGARFHFFTDTALLIDQATQSSPKPFGPFQDQTNYPNMDLFRTTSIHAASSDSKAYALCDGIVCVQKITTADPDIGTTNLINLILKPTQQPALNGAPIKYIIYKGIKESSLINGNEISAQNMNKLTDSIWDTQTKKNQSANTPGVTPPKEALGVHFTATSNPPFADTDSIDKLFFLSNVDFQFPIVRGGWDIGEFNKDKFGIEIIFDSVGYSPVLKTVRTLENIIQVTTLTGNETESVRFENKSKREEVLNFIDPCAFFGSFYNNRLLVRDNPGTMVNTNDFNKKKGNDVYAAVLKGKFANKNRAYLDIRNENNHSINFYENYNNNININFAENDPLTTKDYYASKWPVLMVENSDFIGGNTSKKNVIELSLPVSVPIIAPNTALENPLPLVYISQGYLNKFFPKQLKHQNKFVELTPEVNSNDEPISGFTIERLSLAIPNNDAENATTVISTYVRLKYLKRLGLLPTPVSSGTTLRPAHFLDHIFLPKNLNIPFTSSANIRSVVYDEEAYVDGTFTDVKMDFTSRVGLAEDLNNVTLFSFASDIRKKIKQENNNSFSLIGELRNEQLDFLKIPEKKYANLELAKGELQFSSGNIPYLIYNNLSSGFGERFENVDPDELISIVVSKAEFTSILSIANDPNKFSDKFRVYLGVKNKTNAVDDTQNPYTRFDLVLRGFKLLDQSQPTERYEVTEENTNIQIFLNGEF